MGDGSESYTSASESYSSDFGSKGDDAKGDGAKGETKSEHSSSSHSRSSPAKSEHSTSGDSVTSSEQGKEKTPDLQATRDKVPVTADAIPKQPPGKDRPVKAVVVQEKEIEDPRRVELIRSLADASHLPGKGARIFHGRLFYIVESSAPPPHVVWSSTNKPRKRSPDGVTATEYADISTIFDLKIKLLADMLRASKRTLAYTGAGLSVTAGIGMSAVGSSRGAGSGTGTGVGMAAEPTLAHVVMTELYYQKLLQKWVQRNHDGLPQKAGYPQEHTTEIHGSWFDPSNPVIKYTGSLRDDVFEDMERQADEADLVLVLGTSLTGLNADQCVTKTASRALKGEALGAVVISPQRTPQDGKASLRIFAKADEVMVALARHLGFDRQAFARAFPQGVQRSADRFTKQNRILVPYDQNGILSTSVQIYWDLSPGQRVRISSRNNLEGAQQSKDKGITANTIGIVSGRDELSCSIAITFRGISKKLGLWWLDAARHGRVEYLPVVNVNAKEFRDFDGITTPACVQ